MTEYGYVILNRISPGKPPVTSTIRIEGGEDRGDSRIPVSGVELESGERVNITVEYLEEA